MRTNVVLSRPPGVEVRWKCPRGGRQSHLFIHAAAAVFMHKIGTNLVHQLAQALGEHEVEHLLHAHLDDSNP